VLRYHRKSKNVILLRKPATNGDLPLRNEDLIVPLACRGSARCSSQRQQRINTLSTPSRQSDKKTGNNAQHALFRGMFRRPAILRWQYFALWLILDWYED